jgi:predicted nucleotidyltransferase
MIIIIHRRIFVKERAGTPFRKFFLKRTQAGTAIRNIFTGIDFTRLSVSCYPTAILSNKLAYCVHCLKEKLIPFSHRNLVTVRVPGSIYLEKYH